MITKKNESEAARNLKSTIASFAIEGISPNMQTLRYCRLRDAEKISCQQEIETLKKKYREMAHLKKSP